jgi:transcription-repair coupling factor (superfamily II helicase)
MYHKILDEAVQELKETDFRDLFAKELSEAVQGPVVTDCNIETDLELLIPDEYVSNISERLGLYNRLDNIKGEEQLSKFKESVRDRFGPLPESVEQLIETVQLRWQAEELGFEKLSLKGGNLKGYFVNQDNERYFKSDTFGKILTFVQLNPRKCRLKDYKGRLILTVQEVENVSQARAILNKMSE